MQQAATAQVCYVTLWGAWHVDQWIVWSSGFCGAAQHKAGVPASATADACKPVSLHAQKRVGVYITHMC